MPHLEHYKQKSDMNSHNKHFAKNFNFENNCRKINVQIPLAEDVIIGK